MTSFCSYAENQSLESLSYWGLLGHNHEGAACYSRLVNVPDRRGWKICDEDVNAALALKLDISYTVSEMEEGVFEL